ncbi:MAG: O-antigen ligase family protein [Bryobacteraceae bacterium]
MRFNFERAAFYLTATSVITILFSIAASQILLGLAFAALLISSTKIRLPPIKLPLAIFIAGTVVSLCLSVDPRSGMPQIRKFFVFLVLVLVYSTFKSIAQIRSVVLIAGGVAALSAARSLFQFLQKYQASQELHEHFYDYYVGERITGFMSHWMTLGGEEMIVLLMLAAFLFFSNHRRWKVGGWICVAILSVSVVLGYTRSIFLLGLPAGLLYLLWFWHRWLVVALPAVAVAGILAIPPIRERVTSIVQPHGETDSNLHRTITRRTGLEMIRAHPLFGLGPEQVKAQFKDYVPADIQRPLPNGWYGHLHNIYLQYAAERGLPTLLAMLWLIGKALFHFGKGLQHRESLAEDARFVLHGAIAVILAILAEGFLEYNLGDSEVLTMFLAVLAFGYVAVEL